MCIELILSEVQATCFHSSSESSSATVAVCSGIRPLLFHSYTVMCRLDCWICRNIGVNTCCGQLDWTVLDEEPQLHLTSCRSAYDAGGSWQKPVTLLHPSVNGRQPAIARPQRVMDRDMGMVRDRTRRAINRIWLTPSQHKRFANGSIRPLRRG